VREKGERGDGKETKGREGERRERKEGRGREEFCAVVIF